MNIVLHRLALGVVPFDALTGHRIDADLQVERDRVLSVRRGLIDPLAPYPPWSPLERSRSGRYRLRFGPAVGSRAHIRLWDPARRYTPRVFDVELWKLDEVVALERAGQHDLNVLSRVLRPWLHPGTGTRLPATATGIRGRVVRAGQPVPWARLLATAGPLTARAATDERGEFLLILTASPQVVTATIGGSLAISADPDLKPPASAADRLQSVPVEPVARTPDPATQPLPADQFLQPYLDNPLLRGEQDPDRFVVGQTQHPVTFDVGRVKTEVEPYEFDPQ
jgi:hypothetical protein